ncbi:acyl-CoA synthetase [Acidithiobacillus sp.]|uniref:LpxL/LpxP family acyltransferase n=2 Tax=Acidithiobacillus sp. TaxID=1872118 RepID=UPI0025C6678D|nr:acyl-CoA synthetase [Acidithiobacillus sp.]
MPPPDQASTPPNHPSWAQHPERGSLTMLRVITWISMKLGRRQARAILHLIAGYFFLFAPTARRSSRAYLTRALGQPARIWQIYHHFLTFAATIHDRIYLLNNRFDLFDIHVHQPEAIDTAIAAGQGALLLGAHLGSFEMLRGVGQRHGGPRVVMVMYEQNARRINAMLSAINPIVEQNIIPPGRMDSMIRVHEQLENGALVGLLGDRLFNKEKVQSIPFLGKPALWPSGPFRMAATLRRPIFFMVGLHTGPGKYEIFFEQLADFTDVERNDREVVLHRAMEKYVSLLDKYCHVAPYNWFNFFDFWQQG